MNESALRHMTDNKISTLQWNYGYIDECVSGREDESVSERGRFAFFIYKVDNKNSTAAGYA